MNRRLLIVAGAAALACAAAAVVVTGSDPGAGSVQAAGEIRIDVGDYRGPFEACISTRPAAEVSSCIKDTVHRATAAGDWGPALGMLRESVARVPDMVGRCHNEAHLVGEALYDAGTPLEVLYTVPFSDCRFGFYHGGLTSHTEPMGFGELTTALPSLCSFFGPDTTDATQECVHVLGHFVFDRAAPDIGRALGTCSTFTSDVLAARCVDGVLMQSADRVRPAVTDESVPERALLEAVWGADRAVQKTTAEGLCAGLAADAAATVAYTCFTNVAQVLAVLWAKDYPAIHAVCTGLPETWHQPCFEGIAASGFTAFDWDPVAIAGACHAGDDPATAFCIKSMAVTFGLQGTDAQIASVCDLARPWELDACREGLQRGAAVRANLAGSVGAEP